MFWFILGFFASVVFIIISIYEEPDTLSAQIGWFFKFLGMFEIFACLCAMVSTGLVYAFTEKENMESEIVYEYKLESIEDNAFVRWGDENRLICLTENGDIKTYDMTNKCIKVRVVRDGEVPNVKRITYPKFKGWLAWIALGTLEDDDIIITLPKGVYKPIT